MRRIAPTALLGLLAVAAPCVASPARSDDWPVVRHDGRNTGYSPAEVAPPLRLAWRVRVGAPDRPLLLCSGGTVCAPVSVTQDRSDTVLVSAQGQLLWTLPNSVPFCLTGRSLVVRIVDGGIPYIRRYDWPTRRVVWSYPPGPLQWSWPRDTATVAGGFLYCTYAQSPDGAAVLLVLRLADGSRAAAPVFQTGWWEGPVAGARRSIYWGISHWFRVLDAATLRPRAALWGGGGNAYPMVLPGGLVLTRGWGHAAELVDYTKRKSVRSWYRAWRGCAACLARGPLGKLVIVDSLREPPRIAALDPATGKPLWSDLRRGSEYIDAAGLAGSGGLAYVVASDQAAAHRGERVGGFYGYRAATGKLLWKYERPGLQGVAVIVSGGSVYGLGSDGWLYRFVPARDSGRPPRRQS